MNSQPLQVSADFLLIKIGQLTIEIDVLNQQLAMLRSENATLKSNLDAGGLNNEGDLPR